MTAMRVAAIYDIHGNLPALEVLLDEIRGAAVDRVVVCRGTRNACSGAAQLLDVLSPGGKRYRLTAEEASHR